MCKGDWAEVLQGTLDLMLLKTLDAMGPLHGYSIARRIEQIGNGVLELNEDSVHTALLRLQIHAISARCGASEDNRCAKFYAITVEKKQLALSPSECERTAGLIGRLLRLEHQRG